MQNHALAFAQRYHSYFLPHELGRVIVHSLRYAQKNPELIGIVGHQSNWYIMSLCVLFGKLLLDNFKYGWIREASESLFRLERLVTQFYWDHLLISDQNTPSCLMTYTYYWLMISPEGWGQTWDQTVIQAQQPEIQSRVRRHPILGSLLSPEGP
jgi:hypothetical protein